MPEKKAKKLEGGYEWWKIPEERDWEREQWERHTERVKQENVTGSSTKTGFVIERRPPKKKWPWTGLFSRKRRRRVGRG